MIDFGGLIGALASHGVNFIVVGSVAGAVHGAAELELLLELRGSDR